MEREQSVRVHLPVALDWPADEELNAKCHHIGGSTVRDDHPQDNAPLKHEGGEHAQVERQQRSLGKVEGQVERELAGKLQL